MYTAKDPSSKLLGEALLEDVSTWRVPGKAWSVSPDGVVTFFAYDLANATEVSDARAALDEFIDLARESQPGQITIDKAVTRKILQFIRKWGPLGVDVGDLSRVLKDAGGREKHPIRCESEFLYVALPRAFQAARAIHASISYGERPRFGDWRHLYTWPSFYVPGLGEMFLADERYWEQKFDIEMLSRQLNAWLDQSNVRPALIQRGPQQGSVTFRVHDLFGALTIQLLREVSGLSEHAICSHCRKTYPFGARRPKFGQRHFCQECREKKIPTEYAKGDYRIRKIQQRSS